MLEAGHRAEERRLAGTVGAEKGGDLALGDLDVDVEEHLVRAVEEIEVVDLQRRDGATGLAAPALRVALEHVFDDERDVAADVP